MTSTLNPFSVGDRVYAHSPVNESWNPAYTATVMQVRGELIDIRWDHGPSNSGHHAEDFRLRAPACEHGSYYEADNGWRVCLSCGTATPKTS